MIDLNFNVKFDVNDLNFDLSFDVDTLDFITELSISKYQLTVDFSELQKVTVSEDISPYVGSYKVTPKVANPVMLAVKDKRMVEDVIIEKIPQFEVSNTSGGKTFIIGEEYYA